MTENYDREEKPLVSVAFKCDLSAAALGTCAVPLVGRALIVQIPDMSPLQSLSSSSQGLRSFFPLSAKPFPKSTLPKLTRSKPLKLSHPLPTEFVGSSGP